MNDRNTVIMKELLFQKSLLSEDAKKYAEIDKYMDIAQSIPEADHQSMKDPVEKSIAIVIELIMNNQLDPGAIEILNFSRLYMERIKSEPYVNFIVAGRLIFMAWNVLRLESETMLSRLMAYREEARDVDPNFFYVFDDDPEYYVGDFELEPAVRSNFTREVSIMDLLDAFSQAQAEIAEHLRRASLPIQAPDRKFEDNAHKEDPEKEINAVLEKLYAFGPGPVPFSDLAQGRDDTVTVFLSMLFLARLGRVRIWQEEPPSGEIYMEPISQQPMLSVEVTDSSIPESDV